MSHRRSFAETPRLLASVFELLDVVFPGIRVAAGEAEQLGLDWGAASTPFVAFDGGRVVSHVGVMEVPLVMAGEELEVAAVHAVATHPDYRRRGLYRGCIEEALAFVDERHATVMLTTDAPALYEPFGFRCVAEHRWRGALRAVGAPRLDERIGLDFERAEDVELLHRLLRERAPVSPRLGVVRELHGFAFYAASAPLWYLPALDAVVWYRADADRVVLHDLVAPDIPALAEVLAYIPERAPEVVVEFTGDVFAPELTAEPHNLDGNDWLMVRGDWPVAGQAHMLPRTARF